MKILPNERFVHYMTKDAGAEFGGGMFHTAQIKMANQNDSQTDVPTRNAFWPSYARHVLQLLGFQTLWH